MEWTLVAHSTTENIGINSKCDVKTSHRSSMTTKFNDGIWMTACERGNNSGMLSATQVNSA